MSIVLTKSELIQQIVDLLSEDPRYIEKVYEFLYGGMIVYCGDGTFVLYEEDTEDQSDDMIDDF